MTVPEAAARALRTAGEGPNGASLEESLPAMGPGLGRPGL